MKILWSALLHRATIICALDNACWPSVPPKVHVTSFCIPILLVLILQRRQNILTALLHCSSVAGAYYCYLAHIRLSFTLSMIPLTLIYRPISHIPFVCIDLHPLWQCRKLSQWSLGAKPQKTVQFCITVIWASIFMAALHSRCGHYIFVLCFLLLLSSFFLA